MTGVTAKRGTPDVTSGVAADVAVGGSPETGPDTMRAVARGGLANVAGAVVSAVANFVLVVVVARMVSPSTAGQFFTITSIFLMLEAAGRLGADIGLVYFIARWRALGMRDRIPGALRAAFSPAVGVTVVLAVLLVVLAPWVADIAGVHSSAAVTDLRLLAAVVPFAVAYDISLGATRGFGRMRPTVVVDKVFRPVAQLVLVAVVLAAGWAGGLAAAWVVPYAASFVLAGLALRAALRRESVPRRAHPAVTREFWSFALPRAAAGIAQLLLQRLDIVLVAALRGVTEAAVYTAATRFVVVGQFLNQAIAAPVQPRLSAALARGDTARAKTLYEASTAWLVLCCWPLFGLTLSFAPIYVRLFGKGYADGATVVVLISIALFVASGVGLVDTVVIMAGRTRVNLTTVLLALVVNIGVDVLLIPHYGVIGAAIGWLSSIVAANLVPLAVAWATLGLHPFGVRTYTAYGLAAACYLVLPLATYAVTGRNTVAAVVVAVIGTILYAGGLWRWRDRFDLPSLARRKMVT